MNARIAQRLFLGLFLTISGPAAAFMLVPGAVAQDGSGAKRVGPGFASHRSPFARAFHFGGRFWDNPKIAATLKITPDQQKQMDNILYQHRERLIDLRASLQKSELEMEPLMNADEPNRAAIEAQIDKVVAARAALEKANSNFLLDIRMKLTPDQWEQIKNFRAQRGMHGMHGDWRHDGGQRMHMRGPDAPHGGPAPQPRPAPPPPTDSGSNSDTGQATQQ